MAAAISKRKDVLDITVDLGGDSLKLVYGYKDASGTLVMGKIAEEGYITQIGIPAVAFYSKRKNKWLYGYEVDESGELDFTTVVRIKNLFMLCATKKSKDEKENKRLAKISERNRRYFLKEKHFPKFCLPKDKKSFDDFDSAVKSDRTFLGDRTPEEVCIGYFEYVKELLTRRLEVLFTGIGKTLDLRYSVVYPPKVGAEYKEAFKKVIKKVFGKAVHRELGTTRALGMYAFHSNRANGLPMVESNKSVLIFDIGEEFISTSKVYFENGQIRVDGATGHKRAEPLGGIIVDEALYDYLESGVEERATFAEADPGSANEGCPESKKYQLLKDIKSAKNILSNGKIQGTGIYKNGVDIVIPREFHIQKSLKIAELKDCIGVTKQKKGSVADRIYTFIKEEAGDAINKDVKTVLIAGGVIETLGLDEYIRNGLKKDLGIELLTFDAEQEANGSGFKIYANESSVYASALGMTIASALDKKVSTVLSLTYGTFSYGKYDTTDLHSLAPVNSGSVRSFSIFVDRGEALEEEVNKFSDTFSISGESTELFEWLDVALLKEEMYSAMLTRAESENRKDNGLKVASGRVSYVNTPNGKHQLALGEPPETTGTKCIEREVAEKHFRLERVFYDDIYFWDSEDKATRRRLRVKRATSPGKMSIREGILVTKNGVVTPFIENTTASSSLVEVEYWNPRTNRWSGEREMKSVQSLYFDFKEGKSFTAEVSDDD